MSAGWSCSHQIGNICVLINKPCEPSMKGNSSLKNYFLGVL